MFGKGAFFNRKQIMNILGAVLIIYTLIFVCGMTASAFTEADVPNEYQEITSIMLTDNFIKGINPYSTQAAFGEEIPGVLYFYGPLYSLVTAFFALFIKIDLITLHYAVSYAAMMISAILAAVMVAEKTDNILPPAAAFLFAINCTWRYGYINAVPDTMAFMLVVLSVFIETRKECRFRELLEILCVIAAFYTKIYMAFIAVPLFVYKLIKDRKAAGRFFIYGVVLTGLSVLIITVTCPLLFTYSVYFIHGTFGLVNPNSTTQVAASGGNDKDVIMDVLMFRNKTDPTSGWGYELLQLRSLIGTYLLMFLTAAVNFVKSLKKHFKETDGFMLLMFVIIAVSVPVLLVLGKNDGAWLSYYLQIQVLPVIMLSLVFLNDKCSKPDNGRETAIPVLVMIITVAFTLYRTDQRLPYYYMTSDQKNAWASVYAMLDDDLGKGEIYYSPVLSFHALWNDQHLYNNALNGNKYRDMYYEYERKDWLQAVFPYAGAVMKKNLDYNDNILREKIRNGDFELITASIGSDGTDRIITEDDIMSGPYKYAGEIILPVSRMPYSIKLWRRYRQ